MTQPLPLSQRLRQGTHKAHRSIESLAFLRSFLRGTVDPSSYCRYLVDLLHVYTHLEQGLDTHPDHPLVQPLLLPMLWRRQPLQADLAFLSQRHLVSPAPSAAACRYGERLRRLCAQSPELLVAHAYTRYLGDLSGGQILRRIAARTLQLHGDEGLAFYSFPRIGDISEFRNEYRRRLDSLPVDDGMAEQIIAEANSAFALNAAILKELPGSTFLGLWRILAPVAASAAGG